MATSFEQFRESIKREQGRYALGIGLPQDEADRVAADEALALAYYDNWLSRGLGAHQPLLTASAYGMVTIENLRRARRSSRLVLFDAVDKLTDIEARAALVAFVERPELAVQPRTDKPVESPVRANGSAAGPVPSGEAPGRLSRADEVKLLVTRDRAVWGFVLSLLSWAVLLIGFFAAISLARPGTSAQGIFTGWAVVAAIVGVVALIISIRGIRSSREVRRIGLTGDKLALAITGVVLSALMLLSFVGEAVNNLVR